MMLTARPARVLCVDDEPVNLRVAADLLGVAGCTVICASSGAEALDLLTHQHFDVVLLDIHMPMMSGTETLKAIRKLAGPGAETPVVALTADLSRTRREYLDLGFDEFTPKPVSLASLSGIVSTALSLKPCEAG